MIVAAAIMKDGELWTLPRPARHGHIIRAYADVTGKAMGSAGQGFVTDHGVFCDRATAARHAYECDQIVEPERELFTEDLW